MGSIEWFAISIIVLLSLYLVAILALFLAGRKEGASALARFVPDCAVLFTRLARDSRLPRRHKALLGALAAYLAIPLDLVPDFIPVAGQLDDAVLVSLVLRTVLRGGGEAVVREQWPGPRLSLEVVLRLAGYPVRGPSHEYSLDASPSP
jgi:uncharacterized membrane protein YkvA (DUF1232 family)